MRHSLEKPSCPETLKSQNATGETALKSQQMMSHNAIKYGQAAKNNEMNCLWPKLARLGPPV